MTWLSLGPAYLSGRSVLLCPFLAWVSGFPGVYMG